VTTAIGSSTDTPASSRAVVTGQSGHQTARVRVGAFMRTRALFPVGDRCGSSFPRWWPVLTIPTEQQRGKQRCAWLAGQFDDWGERLGSLDAAAGGGEPESGRTGAGGLPAAFGVDLDLAGP